MTRAKSTLNKVSFFLGELRDGLTMINMQSAFLITSKQYTEKQVGILFVVFGMSQFLFQAPAGYLMDYSDKKVGWLATAAICTTVCTIFTALQAADNGANLPLMILVKFVQGGITAMIPPGLNSITQGIVGSVGMTTQVSMNEMMNHLGTSILVLSGSLIAYFTFPNIGILFVVSPIFCLLMVIFINQIDPNDIDHNAARGLTLTKQEQDHQNITDNNQYVPPETSEPSNKEKIQTQPSFNFFGRKKTSNDVDSTSFATSSTSPQMKADTPLQVLRDPLLLTFTAVCFLFHTANGCILPLVMQSLAIGNGRSGILLSGMCIILAQLFMVLSAKICGQYSAQYGRKVLFLVGFFVVPIRAMILTGLITWRESSGGSTFLNGLILSTQLLDGVGAGVFGTMYILVTSDLSGGTGRFSLTLGITTAAMSIGGTVSGYLGEALAEDFGYRAAFFILGCLALVPALMYLLLMPETLPSYAASGKLTKIPSTGTGMGSIAEGVNEDDHGNNNMSRNGVNVAGVDDADKTSYKELV